MITGNESGRDGSSQAPVEASEEASERETSDETGGAPRKAPRRVARLLVAALVMLVLVGSTIVAALWTKTAMALRAEYDVTAAAVATAEELALDATFLIDEGERLYRARGCADCHGDSLGGRVFLDEPPIGTYAGTNLTRGEAGLPEDYSMQDFALAVRHGIGRDGRSLIFMPSYEYWGISDRDLRALFTYIRSAPPVDGEPPRSQPTALARILAGAGQLALVPAAMIDHDAPRPEDPVIEESVAFGRYLAAGCTGCHGEGFSGGRIPGTPPSVPVPTNITPHESGLEGWSREDFVTAMREGVRPDGSELDPFMPAENFRRMTDTELGALYLYLQQVPAKPSGNR